MSDIPTGFATHRFRDKWHANPSKCRKEKHRGPTADPNGAEYTPAESEFMLALDRKKRTLGHVFLTCSEVLAVLLELGYRK